MMIKEFRDYAEVCEQGIDLNNYFLNLEKDIPCKLILLRKAKINQENIIFKYRKLKNFDAFIIFVTEEEKEYLIFVIEYSNSVRTDDHIMQRFDGVYWVGHLKIPYIKFSSSEINNNNFGGGNKIKIVHEYNIAHKVGAIFKHFDIPLISNTNIVNTNKERLSCPNFLLELEKYFFNIINYIKESLNYNEVYSKLLSSSYNSEFLPEFSNSDRLSFDKYNLTLKFNRFGHVMDPEKGMLYFFITWGKEYLFF